MKRDQEANSFSSEAYTKERPSTNQKECAQQRLKWLELGLGLTGPRTMRIQNTPFIHSVAFC